MMHHTSSARRVFFAVVLALLLSVSVSPSRVEAAGPEASAPPVSDEFAAQAAEVQAAISALKTISLKSEDAVRSARELYDALPEEAQALVTNLKTLEKAEAKLRSLKDKAAAAALKKLYDAKKYDEAIEFAENYMEGREYGDVQGQILTFCQRAYAQKARGMMRQGQYEQAEAFLSACREKYAGLNLPDVKRAVAELERAIAEPENGSVLTSRAKGDYASVTIHAGAKPVLVKLVSTSDPDNYLMFYVRAGSAATAHIRDGTYTMRCASGDKWYGEANLFGASTRCFSVDTILSFSTDRVANDIYTQAYDFVLQAPSDGGTAVVALPPEQF